MKNIRSKTFRQVVCAGICSCFPFAELRYATCVEKMLTIIGILSATAAGFCVPMLMVLFGKLTNSFIHHEIHGAYNRVHVNHRAEEDLLGFRWLKDKTSKGDTISNLTHEAREFAIGMAIVGSVQFFFGALFVVSLNYAAQSQVLRAREAYFQAILYHELGWFDLQSPRDISHNIIMHVNNLYDGLGEKLGIMTYTFVSSVTCITVALLYGWKLALVTLLVFPVLIVLYVISGKVGKCFAMQENKAYAAAEALAEDVIVNIRSVYTYQGEKSESKRYKEKLESSEQAYVRAGTFHGLMNGLAWFTMYCSYALAFYYGVILTIKEDDYTPSILIVVFFCVQIGVVSSLQLPGYFSVMLKARHSASEMFAAIDRIPTIDIGNEEGAVSGTMGSVTLNNVHFCYPSKTTDKVLNGVSFNITDGQKAVLVGISGSGKSTCLKLIHRFYDAQVGSVSVGGKNVRDINLFCLRNKVGFVQQKTALFGSNVLESIVHGLPNITLNDVVNVTKVVQAHDIIMKLPKQYHTALNHEIREDLRQRLAVARVLLHNPNILMLDEAMSHLTSIEEVRLVRSLINKLDNKTLIIVTSRMSTMKLADRIFHIKDGTIIEEGTFQELLTMKGEFYNTVRRTTTLNSMVKFGGDNDDIDEFQPLPCEKLMKMSNLSSYSRTLSTDGLTSNEYIHHDTVHISRIALLPNIVDTPVLTGVQETELYKFSWTTILRMNSNEWPFLFVGCVAAMITGFSLPAYAVLFGECLGVIALKSSKDFQLRLDFYAQMFLIAGFISGVAMIVQGYMVSVSGSKLTKRLRKNAFDAILRQEKSWFDDETNDLDSLLFILRVDAVNARSASGARLTSVTQGVCVMLITSALSIYYNWKLGLSISFFLPFLLIGFIYQNHIVVEHTLHEGLELLKTKLIVDEAVTNIKIVIGLSLQNYFLEHYKVVLLQMHKRLLKTLWTRALIYGLVVSIPFFAYAACMFYGAYLLSSGEIDYENVLKISEALVLGTIMVGQLVVFGPNMVQAQLSATKIMQLLKRQPLIYSPTSTFSNKWTTNGNIIFHQVKFLHPSLPCLPSLKNFSLQIKQGQVVALVGPIGAGQSVPIQLILRFYVPAAGCVLLDEHDVAAMNLVSLRRQMGLADGDPIFFHRSIADNIAYGITSREVKMDEILGAAKQANVHNYVTTLPEGYATVLNMQHLNMTYGQKFRLSLARALLRDPPILLLENLQYAEDEDTEIVVEEAVRQSCLGRTCIVVSNYLKSAIRNADLICVLRKGIIVEEGSHNDLMEARGLYYRMYCKQEHLKRRTDSQLLISTILNQDNTDEPE